ncbi:MAG: ABC transporter permease [Blautia sp.]|nr:ABC transporter permease [Blautia sp.]
MKNLIKAEFFKLFKSTGYRIMLALSVGVGLFFASFAVSHASRMSGYAVLSNMVSFVLFHFIFTGSFTAVFLCGEFSDRTMGTGLFCGLPRRSVFLSKLAAYFAGLLVLLSMVVVVPTVIISKVNGFGIELTAANNMTILTQIIFFWLVCSAMGGFFLFLALATKSAIATIGVGLGIAQSLLVLTSNYVNSGVERYAPAKYSFVYQMFVLEDWEHLQKGLFLEVSLITLAVTLIASAWIFERSELK